MTEANVRRRWVVVVLVLLFGAAAAVGLWIPRAKERMASRASACTSCHVEGSHLGPHEELACQRCHSVPEDARLSLAISDLLGDDEPRAHGAVSGESCKTCHEADAGGWRRQMQTSGHRVHVGEGVACTSCHGGAIHGGDIDPDCASCHRDTPVHVEMDDGDCATCHGFSASIDDAPAGEGRSEALMNIAPWTARVGVERVHGAGDCRTCHNPHDSPEAEADCLGCHRGVLAESVAAGPEGHRDCASCHQPHPPRDAPAVQCLSCHRPPPPGARRRPPGESAWNTFTEADAGTDVDPSALTHDARCGTCHTPHVFEADPEGCPSCHAEMETSLASVDGHGACLGCHEPHSAPPGPGSCGECHRNMGHGRAPRGHRSCLGCHDAHAGAPELVATCGRCHSDVRTQLAAEPERHHSCDGCHRPHGDPARGSKASCAGCHAVQARTATSHASPAAHRECASCHTSHAFSDIQACGGCHADQRRASSTWPAGTDHSGPCTGCHAPHASSRIAACRSCHAEQSTREHTGRHRECATCHEVHRTFPASARGWWGRCASCHGEQARAGRGAPGAHAECRSCHEPIGRQPPRCVSCHETITETLQHQVPDHQRCADCHRGHSVAPLSRDTCLECHEEQATGHFPDAGRCQSCHPFAR